MQTTAVAVIWTIQDWNRPMGSCRNMERAVTMMLEMRWTVHMILRMKHPYFPSLNGKY